ncbi:recombinase family protein [Nocardia brasiliensis]|uniref:recombinase family protein n=1 Tax=Nocardia brasiliensis TaxID=37326 RepID=UPI0024566EF8|nr:recombinase family protein [Nocardia brasiliensis]
MARARKKNNVSRGFQARLEELETVRVGIYVRRSTDDEHQPYSIEAQDERLKAYVASQPGWHIVSRFPDDASGATTERDGLQRALQAARDGVIDVLLVYRVDRFSRNLRDMVTLLDELEQCDVVFRSATEPFDTSTPMGRMLVQMLGMFAQFERDTIIDRVISGMERKAAKGLWKGGRRPYGYTVNQPAHTLVPHAHESTVVRLIFQLYTRDRLGSTTIAQLINTRGHRNTNGGTWSAYQILRILANRIYLGELTFRDITTTNCHEPLVDADIFGEAERITTERNADRGQLRANSSDYDLTGKMRCPTCGTAMVGSRNHGRSKIYRYYLCHNRNRYNTMKCDGYRIDADAAESAVLDALAAFYRDNDALIAAAITEAQRQHHTGQATQQDELTTVRAKITETNNKIDRYLTAFENGSLDPELVSSRLTELRDSGRQLTARRDELLAIIDKGPVVPAPAILADVADHITAVIATGSDQTRKALIDILIAEIKITGPDTLIPVFRIPQPSTGYQPAATNAIGAPTGGKPLAGAPMEPVRIDTNLVELRGIEPLSKPPF